MEEVLYSLSEAKGMAEVMTISQIERQFESEWVLVENPETNREMQVQAGKVLWHSKDRDEVYRKAIELRPRRFAMLYTGRKPEGTEIVVCAPHYTSKRALSATWRPIQAGT